MVIDITISEKFPCFYKSLRAHTGPVTCIAIPNNKQQSKHSNEKSRAKSFNIFATGSADNSIIVWTLHPHLSAKRLLGHQSCINSLEWHPSGQYLTSASSDGVVRIWNTNGWSCNVLYAHEGHKAEDISWSSDGKYLLTCGSDYLTKVWKFLPSDSKHSKQEIHYVSSLSGHTSSVNSCQFSSDNRLIATCSEDFTMKLFVVPQNDFQRAKCFHTFFDHLCPIKCVEFNARGSRIASCDVNGTIRVFDTRTLQIISFFQISESAVNCIRWASERYLLCANEDGTVRIIDLLNDCLLYTIKGHKTFSPVLSVAISSDGQFFVSVGADKRTILWKMNASPEERKMIENAQLLDEQSSTQFKLQHIRKSKSKVTPTGSKNQLYERLSSSKFKKDKEKQKETDKHVQDASFTDDEQECFTQDFKVSPINR